MKIPLILILGGTTEAYRVAEELLKEKREFVLTTATDYGLERFRERFAERVVHVRFSRESLEEFVRKNDIHEIIDCTHPYAREITEIARDVSEMLGIGYQDRIRKVSPDESIDYEKTHYVESLKEAAEFILDKNILRPLFTTGSKDLSFAPLLKGIEVFVRVLPYEDSIRRCHEAGIKRKNIIAMQGPFSEELNRAIIRQYGIDCLVTKQSGKEGGFIEKLQSAVSEGIWFIVLKRRSDG